ncbi:MAG: acylpyruvase [Desulfuromonas sp.]|nr:MAG: acylpyruvase [Desulfuromonas sp.]
MYQVCLDHSSTCFSVGKIVCLGRNYAAHIKELGNAVPDKPVIFMKPATALIHDGDQIVIPGYSDDCHFEVELAVLIGRETKQVSEAEAMKSVAGYGVAIDLTLRDVQSELKAKGLPWEIAKAFDTSCPVSNFIAPERIEDPHNLQLKLWVNGELKQDGNTGMMMRRIPQIIHEFSQSFTLRPGDILLTGTPEGVGPLQKGDRVRAELAGLVALNVSVA